MDNWQWGWDAVSAVATASAAVVALWIWLADRRRSRIQDASSVTLQIRSSLNITDSQLTPGEVRTVNARLTEAGMQVTDARRPFVGLRAEEAMVVRAEILEVLGHYSVEDDGSVVKSSLRGSTVEVVVKNQAGLSAYDIYVAGDVGDGRNLFWDVLHPGESVETTGESTSGDLGWAVGARHLALEFTMGGKRWWVAHGRPAKVVRWQLLRKFWRKVRRLVRPPRHEFREYTTVGGATWRTLKDE